MLILATASKATGATQLGMAMLVMFGFVGLCMGMGFSYGHDKRSTRMAIISFVCGVLMFVAAIYVLINGPHAEHIKVDGRTVDWEAIARQEYRTVDIDGTIVELVKKNDERNAR